MPTMRHSPHWRHFETVRRKVSSQRCRWGDEGLNTFARERGMRPARWLHRQAAMGPGNPVWRGENRPGGRTRKRCRQGLPISSFVLFVTKSKLTGFCHTGASRAARGAT
jgi:hypothetical protein